MLVRGWAAVLVACALLGAGSGTAAAQTPSWTTYHHDGTRSGFDPDSTSPVSPTKVWQSAPLDGPVWAEPLVYGPFVYAVTENDTVYELDAATGTIVWDSHLATPVPSGQLPCGDISPTVGITSTPVIDPSTGRIYVVADTWDGSSASHRLYALNLSDGSVALDQKVDPPGSIPLDQLQRASLALDAGKVIIGYGGNDGDCATYHGWLVAVPEGGGALQTFEVDSKSGDREGAIWGSGNAPAIDSAGGIWIATGNGTSSTFDYQESVIRLNSNLGLVGWWAPSDWSTLDSSDLDLGSTMPLLLPDGLVFEIGKQGIGYLLSQGHLGHTGATPLDSQAVCSGSWGGGIYYNGVIYVSCSDGMHALALNTTNRTFAPLPGWRVNSNAVAPPIFAGGLVWSTGSTANSHSGILSALNPTTGATAFSANLHGFEHFATPAAGGGLLFVANQVPSAVGDQITAFKLAGLPGSSPPTSPLPTSTATSPRPTISYLHVRVLRGKLRLTLAVSQPGTVTIAVWKLTPRRLMYARCRPAFRRGRKCLVLAARSLKRHRSETAGTHRFRLRMRPLAPGEYLVVVWENNGYGRSASRRAIIAVRH